GIPENLVLQARVRTRNQIGLVNVWSPYVTIPAGSFASASLSVALAVTNQDGGALSQPIDPETSLSVRIIVQNTSETTAENVYADLRLPPLLRYVTNSLFIDGTPQSEAADLDPGQVNGGTISAI